jgi:hypothetical protein
MTTYSLQAGDAVAVSVDGGAWQVATFAKRDFADISQATPSEVAAVIGRLHGVRADVAADGHLVLRTEAAGAHASIEIDPARSTAAAALGLTAGATRAAGTGLRAAQLVSEAVEPFRLADTSGFVVVANGRKRTIKLDGAITVRAATAAEIASAVNARLTGVAQATREGRVMLTSTSIGDGSSLDVLPGPTDGGRTDAAAVLGFLGANATSHPYPSGPAQLDLTVGRSTLQVENLTAGPIELALPDGRVVLPAGSTIPLPLGAVADTGFHGLVQRGAIRLTLGPGA